MSITTIIMTMTTMMRTNMNITTIITMMKPNMSITTIITMMRRIITKAFPKATVSM